MIRRLERALELLEDVQYTLAPIDGIDYIHEAVTKLSLQVEYEIKAQECTNDS